MLTAFQLPNLHQELKQIEEHRQNQKQSAITLLPRGNLQTSGGKKSNQEFLS